MPRGLSIAVAARPTLPACRLGIDRAMSMLVHVLFTSTHECHMTDTAKLASSETARETIDSYVTDMLALEQHVQTAVAGQIEDLDEHSEFKGVLIRIHATSVNHVRALESLTARHDQNVGGVSKVVKKAVSTVLGAGAAAIDFVRTEKLPKDLRDDYTAISLAYIGYVMLHTTALSLSDSDVADIARAHLIQHAESLMSLQHAIPAATVAFLASEGLPVDTSVLPDISKTIQSAWT
jgi:hypothetical protein